MAVFNEFFRSSFSAQIWRNAVIISLLKVGKPASQIALFRPVILTSGVVKTLERMVAKILYRTAEETGWLNAAQTGFRKHRSCEDQILRVIQAISDGFLTKRRTVRVLLDYSKAYDKIWKEELRLSMHDRPSGVPAVFLRWISGFLQNKQTNARYASVLSNSRRLRHGLLQGSVPARLLFLFYINSATENVPESANSAL